MQSGFALICMPCPDATCFFDPPPKMGGGVLNPTPNSICWWAGEGGGGHKRIIAVYVYGCWTWGEGVLRAYFLQNPSNYWKIGS